MNTFKKSITLQARHILRENFLCDRRVSDLLSHEKLDEATLSSLRDGLLRKTLQSAASKIPAYSGLKIPSASNEIVQFLQRACPVISKKDLLAQRQEFYPNGGNARPWTLLGKTSGTTGSPLDIFRSFDSVIWENAFVHRHWHWSGFRKGMSRATLRGDSVVGLDRTCPPFWLENKVDHQMFLSTRHLKNNTVDLFSEALTRYKPYIFQAYPSAAFVLAQGLENANQKLDIPWVFTASEMLFPYQRELIESRIGRVMDFYGMAERVAFATECEFGNLHVNSDYSFVEILDENDKPTTGEGFVVGTTFHNHLMPLIRYKLSDRTRWKPGMCRCGRPYPMIEPIHGKFEDVLFGSEGNPISPSIITFAFKGVANIDSSQVAQVGPGVWEIRVVPGAGYTDADGKHIVRNILESVDAGLALHLVLKDEIARTGAGKYRWVVNEWKQSVSSLAL